MGLWENMSFRFGNKYMMRYNNAWIKDMVDWTWMTFNNLDRDFIKIHRKSFPDDFKSAYRGEQLEMPITPGPKILRENKMK